jgi:hypothetical protein
MRREVHIKAEIRYWLSFLHSLRLKQIMLNMKAKAATYELLENAGVMEIISSSQ